MGWLFFPPPGKGDMPQGIESSNLSASAHRNFTKTHMRNGLKILIVSDAFAGLALGMIGPIYAIFVQNIGGDVVDGGRGRFSLSFFSFRVFFFIFPFSKEISPPPNQESKEWFSFGVAEALRGSGGTIRAYEAVSSHHALRACD